MCGLVSQFALLMPLFGTLGVISVWSLVLSFGNKGIFFNRLCMLVQPA